METTILWCRSPTGREFPVAQLSADTDQETGGIICLSSVERPEVLLAGLGDDEKAGVAGLLQLEARINRLLGRKDLRVAYLVRSEAQGPSARGLSFQEFQKAYSRPVLYYRDILAEQGEARAVREETERAFVASGGLVGVANV